MGDSTTSVALDENGEKPLPPRPTTWLDELPPLILRHSAENLRVLDIAYCNITDQAIEGIVAHAPKLQTLNLTGCSALSDRALASIASIGETLDVLLLGHVSGISDGGIVKVIRACYNLRWVDVACAFQSILPSIEHFIHRCTLPTVCRNLTDMAVFEIAGLHGLRRLSLIRVHKLTDMAVYALAEHASGLERLFLSYCDKISLSALHLMLRRLDRLDHLSATGLPSLKRKGIDRFSDAAPLVRLLLIHLGHLILALLRTIRQTNELLSMSSTGRMYN